MFATVLMPGSGSIFEFCVRCKSNFLLFSDNAHVTTSWEFSHDKEYIQIRTLNLEHMYAQWNPLETKSFKMKFCLRQAPLV